MIRTATDSLKRSREVLEDAVCLGAKVLGDLWIANDEEIFVVVLIGRAGVVEAAAD